MGADVSDRSGDFCDPGIIRGFDELFQRGEALVQFLDGVGPGCGVELVESLIVVGGGRDFLAFELGQRCVVPVEKVIGDHADGVIFGGGVVGAFGFGNPASLLGGETGDRGVDGDEPFGLVVGRAEFGQQDRFQGRRWPGGLGCLGKRDGREQEGEEYRFEGHDGFPFVAVDFCVRSGKRVSGGGLSLQGI